MRYFYSDCTFIEVMFMEIHAVIMAGGSGTRIWPVSRQSKPKQYIDLGQGKCMLQQTIERYFPDSF